MATTEELQVAILCGWVLRDDSSSLKSLNLVSAVDTTLDLLDRGLIRVAEKIDGEWRTNQWMKMAITALLVLGRRLWRESLWGRDRF
jgi:2,3,4,5-tetrahydropyridine-2,6-dicarboxylate N-succinyltransferase